MFRLNAAHDIAVPHWHADLSIETQIRFFLSDNNLDFDLDGIAHNHRTVRQSVGRDGCNYESIYIRFEDRPACSERICGGTGRSRDDQAIGFVTGNELRIHEKLEVIQARDGALAHHQLVQSSVSGDNLAAPDQRRSEER